MSILDKIMALFGGGEATASSASSSASTSAATSTSGSASSASASPLPKGGKVDRVLVGESLVGDGNEVAHIDLLIGPRGSAVEHAFTNALANNKDGFTTLLAVVAPNLAAVPNTIMFNKVTIKGATQAVQMFGPAQRAVAMAVADSVEDGTISAADANEIFICVGVFIHWDAKDDTKIQDYNYRATKEAIARAIARSPSAKEVVTGKAKAGHPFAAHA